MWPHNLYDQPISWCISLPVQNFENQYRWPGLIRSIRCNRIFIALILLQLYKDPCVEWNLSSNFWTWNIISLNISVYDVWSLNLKKKARLIAIVIITDVGLSQSIMPCYWDAHEICAFNVPIFFYYRTAEDYTPWDDSSTNCRSTVKTSHWLVETWKLRLSR